MDLWDKCQSVQRIERGGGGAMMRGRGTHNQSQYVCVREGEGEGVPATDAPWDRCPLVMGTVTS